MKRKNYRIINGGENKKVLNTNYLKRDTFSIVFDDGEIKATIIMLNPSTGNNLSNDQTIKKIINFRNDNYKIIKEISIVNLVPISASTPKKANFAIEDIRRLSNRYLYNIIFHTNRHYIRTSIKDANWVILAYGDGENFDTKIYEYEKKRLLENVKTCGKKHIFVIKCSNFSELLTKKGNPRHPSYINPVSLVRVRINFDNSISLFVERT